MSEVARPTGLEQGLSSTRTPEPRTKDLLTTSMDADDLSLMQQAQQGDFAAFEVLVGFLQAYIFTILTAVYIGQAAHPEH